MRGFPIFPELSNSGSPPAEPVVYPGLITSPRERPAPVFESIYEPAGNAQAPVKVVENHASDEVSGTRLNPVCDTARRKEKISRANVACSHFQFVPYLSPAMALARLKSSIIACSSRIPLFSRTPYQARAHARQSLRPSSKARSVGNKVRATSLLAGRRSMPSFINKSQTTFLSKLFDWFTSLLNFKPCIVLKVLTRPSISLLSDFIEFQQS